MCILVLLINYVHSQKGLKGLKTPNQKLNVKLLNVLFQ